MDSFTADDLRALRDHSHKPCVSLLMRTTPGGRHEDRQRWKGLLEEADHLLHRWGESGPKVKALLGPALDLLDDSQFWQDVSDGVAVFLAPQAFRTFRVPLPLGNQVVVGDSFHTEPLTALLKGTAPHPQA